MIPPMGRAVGRDWVLPDGDDVIVVAARELSEWRVTKYRKTAVVFDGRIWYVADYEPPAGRRTDPKHGLGHRYRLVSWPGELHDLPARKIVYDADFTAARDNDYRSAVRQAGRRIVFVPFYPVLGLLPAGVKHWLEERCGVRSVTATRQSLRLEYVSALVFGGSIVPTLIFDDPLGIGLALPAVLGLGSLLDFIMRWDRSADEHPLQYGAFEWLFRKL